MMPQLVLLAGGLATRLYPLTRTVPKSMVEVAGEPFIKHQLTLLKKKGITSVLICAGYLGEEIKEYVGDGKRFGISVDYSFDGDRLLGTGGALVKALPLLGEVFWVMYGDSFLDTDFNAVYQFFKANKKPGLMTVFRNENKWDRSNVLYSEGVILKYDKKNPTPDMKHIDYGLALLKRKVLEMYPRVGHFDLSDMYGDLVDKGEMLGFEVGDRFYQIGSFEGLQEADAFIRALKS